MMMFTAMMFVVVAVTVSTAFRLKGGLHFLEIGPQATEHVFDYVVGPNKKNVVSNFGRQMPIAQVPGKTYELYRIVMSDFNEILRCRLNL